MEKLTRKILFWSVVSVFVIAGPLLVLWSQGIKIDFQQKKFVRTGGIFINSLTPKVEIYLDGELKKETGLLSNSILLKNLLPENYQVEIKKDGYYSWQKNLSIKEKEVIEVKNIILFKKNLRFDLVSQNTEEFLVNQEQRQILLKNKIKNIWSLEILDLAQQKKQLVFSSDKFEGANYNVEIDEWYPQDKQVLLRQANGNNKKFFVLDYSSFPEVKFFDLSFGSPVKKIILHPAIKEKILFLKENKIFSMDIFNKEQSEILATDVVWFETENKVLFLINSAGFVFRVNLTEADAWQKKEVLNKTPLSLAQKENFRIFQIQENFFLYLNEKIYKLDEQQIFEEVFSGVKNVSISPDSQKIAFLKEQEIWLSPAASEPSEDFIFLNRFSQNPDFLFWLTPYYLLFNINEEIKISEIDSRDNINMETLGNFKNPKVFFNQINKKIYILSENNFFESEELIP